MKHFLLFLSAVLFAHFATAQSQRLVLVEEFTGENCGPCAASNPYINVTLKKNLDKVVSLKYQNDIPSPGPVLYEQTKTEVDARQAYYNNKYSPEIYYDGKLYGDNAYKFDQTTINNAYAIPSPFDISLTHSVNKSGDSIFITMIITAAMDVSTASNFKAHLALCEEEITFQTSPGTNGEKEFYMSMRKMYPNAGGTALRKSWTTGQDTTITVAAKLPAFIYQIKEIAVVGFVQDDANKNIKQGAISTPKVPVADISVTGVLAPVVTCTDAIQPTVVVKNYGSSDIDSCTFTYKVDANSPVIKKWIGSIAAGSSKNILLDVINPGPGKHTLTVTCSDPNGAADFAANNSSTTISNIVGSYSSSPVTEGFTFSTFPPASWIVDDVDRDGTKWIRKTGAGGFGWSTSCAYLPLYLTRSGDYDDLYVKPLDLTAVTKQYVTFNVAYCGIYATENDELSVQVSNNCGASWEKIWTKYGDDLTTFPGGDFYVHTPKANEWRAESADISSYAGQSEVLVKFSVLSDVGNTLFIDDISVGSSSVGVEETNNKVYSASLYPNPSSHSTALTLGLTENTDVAISVTNAIGAQVYSSLKTNVTPGIHRFDLDVTSFASGIYNVSVKTGAGLLTKKLVVVK